MTEETGAARPIVVGLVAGQPDELLVHAARLARDLGAELVCAHVDPSRYPVAEHPDGSLVSLPIDPDLPEFDEDVFDPVLAAHIDAVLAGHDITWSLRSLAGEPSRALAHLAKTLDARLIVVGTHEGARHGGFHEFFGRSIAAHLSHRQHVPVVVVPLDPVTDGGSLPWE